MEILDYILPAYLTDAEKGRLKNSLMQFKAKNNQGEYSYNEFYKSNAINYFMQADLIKDIRYPFWDIIDRNYLKKYSDAIILSNTCDISLANVRVINAKRCLLAPLIELNMHIDVLRETFDEGQIKTFVNSVRAQELTNIFYLPHDPQHNKERIALLDKIFWIDVEELTPLLPTIIEERIATLNHYGLYLFIVKLSYHLCRFPEENDRP